MKGRLGLGQVEQVVVLRLLGRLVSLRGVVQERGANRDCPFFDESIRLIFFVSRVHR